MVLVDGNGARGLLSHRVFLQRKRASQVTSGRAGGSLVLDVARSTRVYLRLMLTVFYVDAEWRAKNASSMDYPGEGASADGASTGRQNGQSTGVCCYGDQQYTDKIEVGTRKSKQPCFSCRIRSWMGREENIVPTTTTTEQSRSSLCGKKSGATLPTFCCPTVLTVIDPASRRTYII